MRRASAPRRRACSSRPPSRRLRRRESAQDASATRTRARRRRLLRRRERRRRSPAKERLRSPTRRAKIPFEEIPSPEPSAEALRRPPRDRRSMEASLIAKQEETIRALEARIRNLEAAAKLASTASRSSSTSRGQTSRRRSRSGSRSSRTNVSKLPEAADVVSVGEFPGSFRIPGTDAALKIGGQVRVTAVESLDAIGTDDRFVTSSIPVEGSEAAGKGARTTLSATPSRFNFDFRTPTGVGAMRAFIEVGFGAAATARGHPSPRVRAVGPLDPRPDVVHVRGSRGRAVRDRQRGPERDLALPPAADPVHDELRTTRTRSRPPSRTRRRTSRTPRA